MNAAAVLRRFLVDERSYEKRRFRVVSQLGFDLCGCLEPIDRFDFDYKLCLTPISLDLDPRVSIPIFGGLGLAHHLGWKAGDAVEGSQHVTRTI